LFSFATAKAFGIKRTVSPARHNRTGDPLGSAGVDRRARQQSARAGDVPRSFSESDILELNIPTGVPLVYELDDELRPPRHFYLGDPEKVAAAAASVASQAKA
jgi:hypothetical protein